jgi:hypothetical protein
MNGTHIIDAIHNYLNDIHIPEDYKTIPCIRYAYNTAVNAQYQNNNNIINDNIINNNHANQNFDIMLTTALNAVNNRLNNRINQTNNQNNQINNQMHIG